MSIQETRSDIAVQQTRRDMVSDTTSFANLLDTAKFEHVWRVAKVFAESGMVPKQFANKPAACFVAVQMAVRLEADPFMVMNGLYMSPDNKPAMYAQLAIALVNARGPFKGPIQFELTGEGDKRACRAFQYSRSTGDLCEMTVDIATAKAEGWYSRNPKWRNIPDLMLRYRAGAWLGRLYAPECLMGLQTAEEDQDVGHLAQQPDGSYAPAQVPPRPTRADFTAPPVIIDEPEAEEPSATFAVVDADGEERVFDLPGDAADALETALSDAAKIGADAVQGIWDSNGLLLGTLRDAGCADRADALNAAYTTALDKCRAPATPTIDFTANAKKLCAAIKAATTANQVDNLLQGAAWLQQCHERAPEVYEQTMEYATRRQNALRPKDEPGDDFPGDRPML